MNIIINGETYRMGEMPGGYIDYGSVVTMAGYKEDRILSVTYHTRRKGDEQRRGTLMPSKPILVEDGMIFTVADTSNA